MPHFRGSVAALCVALGVGACSEEPAAVGGRTAQVRVAFNMQRIGSVSTLSRVALTVDRGTVSPADQPFVFGQGEAEFSVNVPGGQVVFTGTVISNNNVTLYRAVDTVNVASNPFQLDLLLAPIDAVMIVFPDTASLLNPNSANFSIRNAGVQTLTWNLPAPCNANACLTLSKTSGTLPPGGSDVVGVSGFANGTQRTTALRITSNVGFIDLQAVAPVDNAPPLLTLSGIPPSSVNPPQRSWTFSAVDPSPGSGLAANPISVRLRRARPGSDTCFVPDNGFSGTVVPCLNGNNPNLLTDDGIIAIDASVNREGYWEVMGSAADRAGNVSQTLTSLTLLDVTMPVASAFTGPASLPANLTHTFLVQASDNLDLGGRRAGIRYALGFDLFLGSRSFGAYGIADGLRNTASDTIVAPAFMRGWEGTNFANRASGVSSEAQSVIVNVIDVAGNAQLSAFSINAAVRAGAGGAVPPLTQINPAIFAPPNLAHGAFILSAPSEPTVCRSTVACINPAQTILRVSMNGSSSVLVNPFQRVLFHYLDPVTNWWVQIGQAGAPTITDNGFERVYSYALTWTVTGLNTLDGQPLLGNIAVRAVGVHSSGSALASTNSQRTVLFLNN